MKIWGDSSGFRALRARDIIGFLKKARLPVDFTILDLACGEGEVLQEIQAYLPYCRPTWMDIEPKHPFVTQMALQDLVKTDNRYDVIMMLNSYRNWKGPDRTKFDEWVKDHCSYFIASMNASQIGLDSHDVPMFAFNYR